MYGTKHGLLRSSRLVAALFLYGVFVCPPTVVGAQELWCEGLDENGDGIIDEGCGRTCPAPYALAVPAIVSDAALQTSEIHLTRHGSGLLVLYADDRDGVSKVYSVTTALSGAWDDQEHVLGDGVNPASDPAGAWSGDGFGVVWVDQRDGNSEVYFRDLDADGVPFPGDPDEPVSSSNGESLNPAIAWNGAEYLAVWDDVKGQNRDIYAQRVASTGALIGNAIRLTSDSTVQERPVIVWNGSEYLVGWTDFRHGDSEVYATRLDSVGQPLGTFIRVSNGAGASERVSVTSSGPSDFNLAWEDSRSGTSSIWYSRLVGPAYSPSEISVQSGASAASKPVLTTSGEEMFVIWEDGRHTQPELYLKRLDQDGAELSPETRLAAGSIARDPSAAWHGSGVSTLFLLDDGIGTVKPGIVLAGCCGSDIDADGYRACEGDCNLTDGSISPGASEVCSGADDNCDGSIDDVCPGSCEGYDPSSAKDVFTSPEAGDLPRLVWNGNGYGVSWIEIVSGERATFFRVLDTNGDPLTNAVRLSDVNTEVYLPQPVWTGAEYGVIWKQSSVDGFNLVFRGVDAAGVPIGSPRLVTRDPPTPNGYDKPVMQWNGSEYGLAFVEWGLIDPEALLFMRLDREGRPLGRPRRPVPDLFVFDPDLVNDSDGYAVAYMSTQLPYFLKLDRFGGREGDSVQVHSITSNSATRVVAAPWGYGVFWRRSQGATHQYRELDLMGQPVGSVVDFSYTSKLFSVFWIGNEFLVARANSDRINLVRLNRSGTSAGPDLLIHQSTLSVGPPTLAWNGVRPAVVWADSEALGPGLPRPVFALADCCEAAPALPAVTGLIYADPMTLAWQDAGVERYDRTQGDLTQLRAQAGDWTGTVQVCDQDIVGTTAQDSSTPPSGQVNYQLIRSDGACAPGSYGSGGAGEQGTRDDGLGSACP